MRIALLSDTYTPQVNGVTTVVRRIALLLRSRGHDVVVVAPRYPQVAAATDERELRVASVPFPLYTDIRLSLPDFRRIAEFLSAFGPDLIHVHTEGGIGLARRGFTHVAVWGCDVDTEQFHPGKRNAGWRRWLAGGDDTAVALHVGRLAREKNLDVLIDAWAQARHVLGQRATFVVAGAGPYARRIAAHLPFVRQLGFLPREQLAPLYASADVCVFPSQTETCGLVALEAMASGVPVIAADAGGFRETVTHGVTGLLVPPHDARGFAGALAQLVGEPGHRFSFAAAGREAALTRDVAREDEALLAWYARLAEQPNHGTAPRAA